MKSDQSSGGTAQPVSWHLPRHEQEEEGGEGRGGGKRERERERKKRGSTSGWEGGKTQLPLRPSPVLLFKGAGGRGGEGDCWHHLYMSFVFQPSSLHRARLVCSVFK